MNNKTTKRIIAIIITLISLFSFCTVSFAQEKPITVLLDGKQLTFDVDPVLENGRTLVPMRAIFEALGAEVNWNPDTWTAIATKDDTKIEITIDSTEMLKNGDVVTLDVPARLIGSRTLVPVRAVSEGLGADVDWNDTLWQVIITTPVTEDETPDTKEEYDFTQLSPKDMEILKRDAARLRYYFEQAVLPSAFLADAEYAIPLIRESNSELINITYMLWEDLVIPYIINLQVESEDTYITDASDTEITEEYFYSVYSNIISDAALSANTLYEVSYGKTPAGKPLLLVTFKTADELLNCKYIAMTVTNEELRCFTAETTVSESAEGEYMLCEITDKGRGSYFTVKDKTEFYKGIDSIVATNATPGASQMRPTEN